MHDIHIHASPGFDNVVALVVPNEGALRDAVAEAEVKVDDTDGDGPVALATLCQMPAVRQLVMLRLSEEGAAEGLLPCVRVAVCTGPRGRAPWLGLRSLVLTHVQVRAPCGHRAPRRNVLARERLAA